jgi:hypothetical protein
MIAPMTTSRRPDKKSLAIVAEVTSIDERYSHIAKPYLC